MNRTYLDTLPEELLIEICMHIKSDHVLYKLSEYTKKAFVKYLNLIKNGYINTFSICGEIFYDKTNKIIQDNKIKLVFITGLRDITTINKLYYYSNHWNTSDKSRIYELIYKSDTNYFYIRMKTYPVFRLTDVKCRNNWKDFWNSLNDAQQKLLLYKDQYNKYLSKYSYGVDFVDLL